MRRSLVVMLLVTAPLFAQLKIGKTTYIIGPTVGDHLVDALRQAGEAARTKADFGRRIALARERYWTLYPDQDGFADAARELQLLLFAKDVTYLGQRVAMETELRFEALEAFTGGKMDGGIPKGLERPFGAWMVEFRRAGGASFSTDDIWAAIKKSWPDYERYVRLRDLDEFRRAGRVPPGYDAATWAIARLIIAEWNERTTRHEESLAGLELLDPREVRAAVDAVKATSADADGRLPVPVQVAPEFGDWQDVHALDAVMHRLAMKNTRAYVIELIRTHATDREEPFALKVASEAYDGYSRLYGEKKLLAWGKEVAAAKKITKRYGNPIPRYFAYLADPSALGCKPFQNEAVTCMREAIGDLAAQERQPARDPDDERVAENLRRRRQGRGRAETPAFDEELRVRGEVTLDVEPRNAQVYLRDGERFELLGNVKEFTRDRKLVLDEGSTLLVFRGSGFRDHVIRVIVDPDGDDTIHVSLSQ